MKELDDNIPDKSFDSFLRSCQRTPSKKETKFALAALMEISPQYKVTIELGILGQHVGKFPKRVPLPTLVGSYGAPPSMSSKLYGSSTSYQQRTTSYQAYEPSSNKGPPHSS